MDLSLISVNAVIAFLLILFRISGMLVAAPLFGMQSVPVQMKIGLAFAVALILYPLHSANFVMPVDLIQFSVMVAQELIIGLLIGFTANLLFTGVQMAGEFISFQMGMSVANVLDPVNHTQVPVLGQLLFYLAILVFLSLNIHHALIVGIDRSFEWLPLGQMAAEHAPSIGMMTERFIRLTAEMFVVALVIGVPIMGILLVTEIALAFVAKVMPQMNIFMVGIPLKVAVGLTTLMVAMPFVSDVLEERFHGLVKVLLGLYRGG